MLCSMHTAFALLWQVSLVLKEVIFPVVSIMGQNVQFCGSGHSRRIIPAVPGLGESKGICVLTNNPLRLVFFSVTCD